MANRLKHVLREATLQDDEFIIVRISIINMVGVILKGCKLSERDELTSDKAVL
jgi:hypothetical protein